MADQRQVAAATGLEVYFADPHSPWQRGSNENTNGLLRQYFPKGSNLAVHSPARLEQVQDERNGPTRGHLRLSHPALGSRVTVRAREISRGRALLWPYDEAPAG